MIVTFSVYKQHIISNSNQKKKKSSIKLGNSIVWVHVCHFGGSINLNSCDEFENLLKILGKIETFI